MESAIGTYSPCEDYLHPYMKPIVDRLFEEGLAVEAHEIMELSIEYAKRLKYAGRLINHNLGENNE